MGGRAQRTKGAKTHLEAPLCAETMTDKVAEWVARQVATHEPPEGPDREQFHRQMDRLLTQTDFIADIVRGDI